MKPELYNETGNNSFLDKTRQQFGEVVDIILSHRSRASHVVNNELLLTAWQVGAYVSAKFKSAEWGSRIVTQLSEYIRTERPDLKGYSRRNIYNMVMFYDEYSSLAFTETVRRFLGVEFVQPGPAQMPKILELTTLTNHIEILCRCKTSEERMFYILYANKERLVKRELQRCISNQTFSTLLAGGKGMSKGLLEISRSPCNV